VGHAFKAPRFWSALQASVSIPAGEATRGRRATGWALRGLSAADRQGRGRSEIEAIRRQSARSQLELLSERLLAQPCDRGLGSLNCSREAGAAA